MTLLAVVIASIFITRWVYSGETKPQPQKPKVNGIKEGFLQEVLGSFYKSPRERRRQKALKRK